MNKTKPINPLSFKEENDKSIDNSINLGINSSIISENKLHSYAEKTKLNMEKMKSFKNLGFNKKNNNIETKYANEFNHIDNKSKAAFEVCENLSSKIHPNKTMTNFPTNNHLTNPFNTSNKINNFPKPNQIIGERVANNVRFKTDDVKETINSTKASNQVTIANESFNNNNISKLKNTSTENNINQNNYLIEKKDEYVVERDENLNISIDGNIKSYVTEPLKFNSKIISFNLNENNDQLDLKEEKFTVVIANKLKSLVSDTKLKAEKVLKTGSLLSMLNFGIKATPIFSSNKLNVADVKIKIKIDVY